ncbi:unnamed protein product, partial [Brenthis ino]
MCADPLKLIPIEKWEEIKSAFKCDLPRSLSVISVLETQEYINKFGLDYGFKVFCPFGDVNNGIVALNVKSTYYEVIIQSPKDDTTVLCEALRQTKLIDWTKNIEVPFAPQHIIACVKKIINEKNLKIDHITMTETFLLDTKSSPFDVSLPPASSFEVLSLEYTKLIDAKWPHRYPGSEWYIDLLIKAKLGYGLFVNGELAAWVFIKEMGALGHLYTLEDHRRKGYGELVLKLISNWLLEKNKYVFAFCVDGNKNAYNLYKKLGFKSVVNVEWCTFTKLD